MQQVAEFCWTKVSAGLSFNASEIAIYRESFRETVNPLILYLFLNQLRQNVEREDINRAAFWNFHLRVVSILNCNTKFQISQNYFGYRFVSNKIKKKKEISFHKCIDALALCKCISFFILFRISLIIFFARFSIWWRFHKCLRIVSALMVRC